MQTTISRIEQVTADWPAEPREAAQRLTDYYGEPDEITPSYLIWHEKAKPWKRTMLSKQQSRHDFPSTHYDYVQQTIDYRVPVDRVGDLAAYDGSIIVDRTPGELSARCGGTSKNFLAINLAHDIVEGRKTVDEARRVYGEVAKRFDEGDKDRLTQEFTFALPQGPTGDADRPVGA
jgi:hypothetical protein